MQQEQNNQKAVLVEESEKKDGFQVKLENFQGPFDLLLHLIEEQKVEIYDVSIAQITSGYLEYLAKMQENDLEIAGEFLIMAAALLEMKSKMLLPTDDTSESDLLSEIEAERLSLLERLVEYKKFKSLAQGLEEKNHEFSRVFSREKINEQMITAADEDRAILLKEVSMQDLLKAFSRVWKRASERQKPDLGEIIDDKYTVREKMGEVVGLLRRGNFRFYFDDLFKGAFNKMEVITTFLALLELVRQRFIRLMQEGTYGKIEIVGNDIMPQEMEMVDETLAVQKEGSKTEQEQKE